MIKRKKIGLFFVYNNTTNAGIVNYLFSFIKALNRLEDSLKPKLVIFCLNDSALDLIKSENYPYISFIPAYQYPVYPSNILLRFINRFSRKVTGKSFFEKYEEEFLKTEYLFPYPQNDMYSHIKGKVNWLVDFNPYYFKDHLPQEVRIAYFEHVKRIVYSNDIAVLSSYDILNDLKKFHPDFKCRVEILRFAAVLPAYKHLDVDKVLEKFNVSNIQYVITPNQFWVHKNHIVMFKAAKLLKEQGLKFKMLFTGSTKVESESEYLPSLLAYIEDNNLEEEINILGIVDRSEQLTLMEAAAALVQPSLFEGWSTLVEESKALNKHIVVSDLPIHREQIDINCTFFDPQNEIELANILRNIFEGGITITPHDYNEDVKNYANRILEIFS